MVVKIVYDELVSLLGESNTDIDLNACLLYTSDAADE